MLEIRTLGTLSVSLNGEPVVGLASRKVTALLVYLACTRVPHPREVLAEFLWEEQGQEQALGNLRVALASLKSHIGPYLDITRQTLACNPNAPTHCDAVELTSRATAAHTALAQGRSLSAADRAAVDAALSEYGGNFLHGFYVKDSIAFEEWALMERERLRVLTAETMCALAEDALARHDYRDAAARAVRLLHVEPTREACHRKAMLALALAGDRAGALAQYERCRRILADELDVEPEPETVELYRRIREGKIAAGGNGLAISARGQPPAGAGFTPGDENRVEPVTKPPAALPRPLTPLIGREMEVEELAQRIASGLQAEVDGAGRQLTICGPGGIGKTRLALAVAAAVAPRFEDGVVLVDLAGVSESSLLPGAVAAALGVQEQPGRRSSRRWLRRCVRSGGCWFWIAANTWPARSRGWRAPSCARPRACASL